MNAEKWKGPVAFGASLILGSAISVFPGIAIDGIEQERMKARAAEFSSSLGMVGTLSREPRLEGGSVIKAYRLKKQGAAIGYVFYLEGRGFSGKAGFLSAFAPGGALRAARPEAVADAAIINGGWPSDDALRSSLQAKEGAPQDRAPEGDDYDIALWNLSAAVLEGRNAIESAKRGTK